MNKKLFSIIIASAFAAGSAGTAAGFDLNAQEVNAYDLLAFYSGRQMPAKQTTYLELSPSGAWRLRNTPSPVGYNFFTNPEWMMGGPSLIKSQDIDLYQFSFSDNSKQLTMSFGHDRDTLQGGAASDRYRLKAAGQYSFGNYYAATGFSYSTALSDAVKSKSKQRLQNLGVFMEAGKRIANLSTGLMYVYMNADDTTGGNDLQPFYLFTVPTSGFKDSKTYLDQAQTISLYAGYDFGNQFNLRGGLGIAKLDERAKANRLQKEESYRWSVNLDANYRLLDNLVYEAHFGFLDSGDLFDNPADDGSRQPSLFTDSPVYRLTNQLTMTF